MIFKIYGGASLFYRNLVFSKSFSPLRTSNIGKSIIFKVGYMFYSACFYKNKTNIYSDVFKFPGLYISYNFVGRRHLR